MLSLRAREVRRSLPSINRSEFFTLTRLIDGIDERKEVGMSAAGECTDLVSLARFLGFAPQHIFYLVENPDRFYVRIEIPKKSIPDAVRELDIPILELKGVQRTIHKKILSGISVSSNVHSYVHGKSVLSAANAFCPGRAVLKLDIQDFFPSISFKRVFGLFRSLGFNEPSAFILTRLTTLGDRLAQGAPTSPMLSNLIVRGLDRRLEGLVDKWEMGYIRYSDDLFFYNDKNFNHTRLATLAINQIENSGFAANLNKTKYHPKGLPRVILGLLTHGDRPRIPGPQRHKYRSLFFKASRDIHWAHLNRDHLRGIIEWYKCVHGKDEQYSQYRAILDNVSQLRLHDTYKSG